MHQRTFSFETTLSFETTDGRVGTAVLTAGTSGWRIIEAVDEDGHALIVPPSVAAALRRRANEGADAAGM